MKLFRSGLLAVALLSGAVSGLGARAAEVSCARNNLMVKRDGGQTDEAGVVARAAGPVALGRGPVRVPLAASRAGATLAARLDALRPGRRIYLVLEDLRAPDEPGVAYHIYLDLPAGARPAKDDPRYVGSFNYFNAVVQGDLEAPADARTRSYDVTDVLRRLRARRMLGASSTLTILPGGPAPAHIKPLVGRITIVEE